MGDLNGDFLDDIMYTEAGSSSQILVALQLPTSQPSDPPLFYTTSFDHALVIRSNTNAENSPESACIQKPIENKRLTVPHSTALIDFDGDCMADLFVTIQDLTTGKKYYEIYLRREKTESVEIGHKTSSIVSQSQTSNGKTVTTETSEFHESPSTLDGLGSFCLVSREEVPEQIHNLFNFADIDRDGMIDLFYVNMHADLNGINMVVHYNGLKNAEASNERNKI